MYPSDWHRYYGDKTYQSAKAILPRLVELFGIESTIEVGCGNAHWTQAAIDIGIEDYLAVDGQWNDRQDLLIDESNFLESNLENPIPIDRRYDAAICLEVAEHVSSACADIVVKSLTSASDILIFGAAIPLQGGYGHINEQWPSWWMSKFCSAGYEMFDLVRPIHWNDKGIHYWYRQNILIYVSKDRPDLLQIARHASSSISYAMMIDAVHPEKYIEMASYEALSIKRLMKRLPSWAASRVRSRFGL